MDHSKHTRSSLQLPVTASRGPTGPGLAELLREGAANAGAGRPAVRSLYIHTPFCSHKCHYCDFYSFVDTRDQQEAFVTRLSEELEHLATLSKGEPLKTIFVGGGTPSLLRVELWERLLGRLGELFDLSLIRSQGAGPSPEAEFTVECNPESATPELMGVLKAGGVTRASMGAQSFEPRHLRTLQRLHDPESVPRALEYARSAGIQRRSIDLIYAIPGQTLEEWASDLAKAVSLGTTHLSAYNLTYEPNTAMTHRLAAGEFESTNEELEADMYRLTKSVLGSAGLERYEVSNYARPGQESLHNLAYWRLEQWLAAGPSASGHVLAGNEPGAGSWRWKNVPRLGDYLASSGLSPVVDVERPEPARLVREMIMMGLRLREGLEEARVLALAEASAPGSAARLTRTRDRLRSRGLFVDDPARWRLTDDGMLLCDGVAAELMGVVRSQ